MKLLHYGLQRSGTNLLESLLKKNFRVRFLNSNEDRSSPLQKHCRLYRNKEIIPEPQYRNNIVIDTFEDFKSLFAVKPDYYLVISKDPYSWYLSYKKWAVKCNWPNVSHHYAEEYSLFYKKFIELSRQSNAFIFVRYLDLIKDSRATLDALGEKMNLRKTFLSRLGMKIPRKVSQSAVFSESKRTYYLNEEYLREYGPDEILAINKLLDPEVLSVLGYELRGFGSP